MDSASRPASGSPLLRPACAAAGLLSLVGSFGTARAAMLDADAALDFWALAVVMLAVAVAVTLAGVLHLGRRLSRRPLLAAATVVLVVLAGALSGAATHAWAYADPAGRYARAYGADGRCLAGTAYGSDQVRLRLWVDDRAKKPRYDLLHATPGDPGAGPVLTLRHASKNGELGPDDRQTAAFLTRHHC